MRRSLLLPLLFFWTSLAAEETDSLQLQFVPDKPIIQKSEIIVDIEQDFAGETLHSRSSQVFESEITILNATPDQNGSVAEPPVNLQVVLKRCKVDVQIGDNTVTYDTGNSEQVGAEPFVAQMKKVMDYPIHLKYGEAFSVIEQENELSQLTKDLPALERYLPSKALQELYEHLFLAAGSPLTAGTVLQRSLTVGQLENVALPVAINIVTANYKEVEATLSGQLEEKMLKITEPTDQSVEILISGQMSGRANWMRRNALLSSYRVHHFYDGRMRSGSEEWPVRITITQRVESHRKSQGVNQ